MEELEQIAAEYEVKEFADRKAALAYALLSKNKRVAKELEKLSKAKTLEDLDLVSCYIG